jgi:glyoxylase-like metal-dependent hydrolase (beta-lactamase superfamily II)
MTLYLNNEIVHLSHFGNAHTNSDAIIHFKRSNVFHLGDIFVRYGIPFIDVPNGGDIEEMISTCERIISITDENSIIIPGHGPISNKNDLINYVEMLTTIRDRISNGIQKGYSLEQILESNPANEYNSIVEKDKFIELYYNSLKKNY